MKYLIFCLFPVLINGQHISDFTSVEPVSQAEDFIFPNSHAFQILIEAGDPLTAGGTMREGNDFTGYIPLTGSTKGIVGINSELITGSVAKLIVEYSSNTGWQVLSSQLSYFPEVNGTSRNCSGHITSWGTIISCEEIILSDANGDGWKDAGWCFEIDTALWKAVDYPNGAPNHDKIWEMGCMNHENVIIHPNNRTCYTGADSNPGYIYKYIANAAGDLSSGDLYVYKAITSSTGVWVQLPNKNQYDQNRTRAMSDSVGAKVFNGVEDIEISPLDGKIYFAVKNEDRVYRFDDTPFGTSVSNFETYFGGQNYDIDWGGGTTSVYACDGADNLVFDNLGNLWLCQDGGNNYIWVIKAGHTQSNPDVEIFGIAPYGSEPTGLTFTPDFKYGFMSFQHPSSGNNESSQPDAFGTMEFFDKACSFVFARSENLGNSSLPVELILWEGKTTDQGVELYWEYSSARNFSHFEIERNNSITSVTKENHYLDMSPEIGYNYYRLKMVDNDGSHTWSSMISVYFKKDGEIQIQSPNEGSPESFPDDVIIFNTNGQRVIPPLARGVYIAMKGEKLVRFVVQ